MKATLFIPLFLLLLLVGCGQATPSLEDEIRQLPDEWSFNSHSGASSNNVAMLSRILSVSNVAERIRLTQKIRNHFRHAPGSYIAEREDQLVENQRFAFADRCARQLISGVGVSPEEILAGWKMYAEYIDDLEQMIRIVERSPKSAPRPSPEDIRRGNLALRMRGRYQIFFRYQLLDLIRRSYEVMPENKRGMFEEQIRHDFFGRDGMKLADFKVFPLPFRK